MTKKRYKIYEKLQIYSCCSAILILIISSAVLIIVMDLDFVSQSIGKLIFYFYLISLGVAGLLLLLAFVLLRLVSPQQKKALNEIKRYIDKKRNISLGKVKSHIKTIMKKYNVTISNEEVFEYYNRKRQHRLWREIEREKAEEQRRKEELRKKIQESPRHIPVNIRTKVWKRDKGRCILCGSQENFECKVIMQKSFIFIDF